MSENEASLPSGPCPACAELMKRDGEGWCRHNECGAGLVSMFGKSKWISYSPVTEEEWRFIRLGMQLFAETMKSCDAVPVQGKAEEPKPAVESKPPKIND